MFQSYQEKEKILVIPCSDTIYYPNTVMIHFQHASVTYIVKYTGQNKNVIEGIDDFHAFIGNKLTIKEKHTSCFTDHPFAGCF